MNGGEIKATLNGGGAVFGMMLTMTRNMRWGNILAGGGIDFAVVDTEHAQRSRAELTDLMVMLKGAGIAPIIRVPFPVPHYVAMALDAGADGVLVPYCEDPEEVKQCIGVKEWHPLKGEYLQKAIETGVAVNERSTGYLRNRHKDHIIIIGVESEPAYKRLDEILAAGDMDCIFVGPNDMSTSLGIPDAYEDDRYWEVVGDIIRRSGDKGVPVMVHQQNIPHSTKAIELGARFIMHSSEGRQLQMHMQHDFGALREAAEKTLGRSVSGDMEDTVETV